MIPYCTKKTSCEFQLKNHHKFHNPKTKERKNIIQIHCTFTNNCNCKTTEFFYKNGKKVIGK